MVDLPDNPVFRNALEERSNQIAMKFQADVRMQHSQSYDYSVPGVLTIRCLEAEGGRPFLFTVKIAKSDAITVERELDKAVTAYDRGA